MSLKKKVPILILFSDLKVRQENKGLLRQRIGNRNQRQAGEELQQKKKSTCRFSNTFCAISILLLLRILHDFSKSHSILFCLHSIMLLTLKKFNLFSDTILRYIIFMQKIDEKVTYCCPTLLCISSKSMQDDVSSRI